MLHLFVNVNFFFVTNDHCKKMKESIKCNTINNLNYDIIYTIKSYIIMMCKMENII